MKIEKMTELLDKDALYGYCHKTSEWEKVETITDIVIIPNRPDNRKGIKAVDSQNRKLYNQVTQVLLEQLMEKFPEPFETFNKTKI